MEIVTPVRPFNDHKDEVSMAKDFGSLVSPGVQNCYNINHLCLHV